MPQRAVRRNTAEVSVVAEESQILSKVCTGAKKLQPYQKLHKAENGAKIAGNGS